MKKLGFVIILFFIVLTGCQYEKSDSARQQAVSPPAIISEPECSYSVDIQRYIDFEYPQIRGTNDDYKEELVNDLILREMGKLSSYETMYLKGFEVECKCKITMATDEFLSMIFISTGSDTSISMMDTLVIDMKDVKKMELTDFVTIDENFAEQVGKFSNITKEDTKRNKDLLEYLRQDPNYKSDILKMLKNKEYYGFYITTDSLGVGCSFYHLDGAYLRVEISYDLVSMRD